LVPKIDIGVLLKSKGPSIFSYADTFALHLDVRSMFKVSCI